MIEQAGEDNDIKVLMLPPDAHRAINALQRSAIVVLQKSLKEGFGLTVTEALWKSKPVIGGACGGITIQVHDYHTGFLVHSPAGAAYRIRYLLRYAEKRQRMGADGTRIRARALPAHAASARLPHDAADASISGIERAAWRNACITFRRRGDTSWHGHANDSKA